LCERILRGICIYVISAIYTLLRRR
jgi:hypothetical protein